MALGGLNNLADQLFAEKPARRQDQAFDRQTLVHRYLESRVFSGSRGIHPESQAPPQQLWETALSDKLMNTERLGPYERQLLASLLRAPHSLVVVTGSTGSGKSSSLRSILSFYDENATLTAARARLGLNPKHVYVDFNKLEKEFEKVDRLQPGSGLALLYDKLPIRIAQGLLRCVIDVAAQRKCPPMQVVLELARDAYRWVSMDDAVPNECAFEWPDLLTLGPPELTGNPRADFEKLQRRLQDQANDHKQSNIPLLFWCAVLDALAIKALPTGKTTLLLLDNIDPLPDDVQRSLRDEFIGLCLDKQFKVVLPLRHSRFRNYRSGPGEPTARSKQAVAYNWYPHSGANPVEIVCSRLLGFIAQPENYPAFGDLDHTWQQKALHRALELLLRLTRGGPHYRSLGQLAVAGAGDSVRRALQTIRFMFESNEYSFDYIPVEAVGAISQLAVELQAMSCSSSVGLAIREEVVGIAMECGKERITQQTVETWGARIAKVAHSIIVGAFDTPHMRFEARVDTLWAHAELHSIFEEDVETACALLHERVLCSDQSPDEVSRTRPWLAAAFEYAMMSSTGTPPVSPGFTTFVSALSKAISGVDSSTSNHSGDERSDFGFSWDRLRICANVLSTNRSHILARSLVRAGYLHNLFVEGDSRSLSLLPLTLLYYLAFQEDGEAALAVILELIRQESDEKEALAILNRLCNEKGRVLWINQDFAHDSYEELESLGRAGCKVRLTHGGWAYYLGVLDEIDYLMETLSNTNGHRGGDFLSTRLESTLRNLEILLNARSVRRDASDPLWLSIQKGVIADIIVRCTPGLIRAARGHFSKMQDPRTGMSREVRFAELQHTRQVVLAWKGALSASKDRACSGAFAEIRMSVAKNGHLVPLGRVGRFRGLGPAAGSCQARWRDAVAALEDLLRGPDLWAASFGADEYRFVTGTTT
jgi:hypothetical protein